MALSNKVRIGYPGQVFEIPAPSSGMGFSSNSDVEVIELDSGGRFVHNKPTTYQTLNMNWRSTTPALQPLLDIYNKRYGRTPFHIQDMRCGEGNLLPARWAYSYQLAHVAGAYGRPQVIESVGGVPTASFTGNEYSNGTPPGVRVMLVPGKNHYFAAFGANGAGTSRIGYQKFNKVTKTWTAAQYINTIAQGAAPTVVCTALETETYDFIYFFLSLSAIGFIQLYHMDFSTTDYRSYEFGLRPGEGYGGLQFTNELGGELTMLRGRKIGLSVDMIEVEN